MTFEKTRFGQTLNAQDRQLVLQRSMARDVPAGQRIFNEGDAADGLFVILEGEVEIRAYSSPNQEHLLSRMEAGEYFGEMAVFDGGSRSASAIARNDCCLLFLSSPLIWELIDRSPNLAAALVRDASVRMRNHNRRFLRETIRAERLTLVERIARTIVHDFRNPLNVIGIAADLAAEEKATTASRRSARDRIRQQVEVLDSLLQELLDFTRSAPANVVLARCNYGHLLAHIVLEFRSEGSRRGVAVDAPDQLPEIWVRADPPRLSRVFTNLFQNAFDAVSGLEHGRVRLQVAVQDDVVVTEVSDNGPGIPEKLLPHLFEPFVTFGKAHGTGLGLAICDRIITEHNGHISAANQPQGGAAFRFSLPLHRIEGEPVR